MKKVASSGGGNKEPIMGRYAEITASVFILRTCAKEKDLSGGTRAHADVVKAGLLELNSYVAPALVSMYAKCGAFAKAKDLLHGLPLRDVFSWSALIAGYAQQGQGREALACLEAMQHEGLSPNAVTFISSLQACGSIKALEKGQQIHDEIVRKKLLGSDVVLGNALVAMYTKCGALAKAQQVLDELPIQDVAAWSALTGGYVEQGQDHEALRCFEIMQKRGLSPSIVTFTCILRACGHIASAEKGQRVLDEIRRQGLLGKDIRLDNAVITMYVKCGMLGKAREVLEGLPVRDVYSWSVLIAGYSQEGQGEEALTCFELMRHEGLLPNSVTFMSLLKACGSIGAADAGEMIHEAIFSRGLLEEDLFLGTALVDMYAKCGELSKARRVLQEVPITDVVSWSALITGYAQQGQGEEALNCFQMMQDKGLQPNSVTYSCVLKACGSIGAYEKGEQIHDEIAKQGLLEHDVVLGNALVDMYLKCGALAKAQEVRNKLPAGDVVSWSSLIAGYVQQGQGDKALNCFKQMQHKGISPDAVTFICVLQACSILGALKKGELIHDEIAKGGLLKKDIALGNALVDMYVKCGALAKAQQALDELPIQDVVVWSALIAGYAQQGKGQTALKCFDQMQCKGLLPDPYTMTSVLNACSHSGLVEEGQMYFVNFSIKYGITPNIEHFTCMIDLFGRAGHFEKAILVIQEIPSSDYLIVWTALLGACRRWEDVNVGRWAFEHAVQVDNSYASIYVCMANIYTAASTQKVGIRT